MRGAGPRPDGGPPAGNPSPPVYQVPESFDAFYAREYPGLVRLALVLSGSRHAAEDLAQDALVAAYRNWSQLVQPLAWTRRVVANLAASAVRRRLVEVRALTRLAVRRGQVVVELPAEDARIWRIDPASDRVTASFPVGPGDGGLLAAHGALWVATNGGTVLRLDPATGRVVKTIDVRNPPSALVSLDGAIWVASGGNAVPGGSGGPAATIARIDPGSNRVTTRIPLGGDLTHGMAAGAGALWVAIDTGAVLRVDRASGQVTASVAVGGIPDSVAAAADTVLVSFVDRQDVARIDPASNQVTARVPVGSGPPEVAVGAGGAWVTNPQTDTVDRLDPHATR